MREGAVRFRHAVRVFALFNGSAAIVRSVEQFGRLDTLIANAGYGLAKPVVETSPEEMQRIFAVNVLGTHNCVRPAVAVMRRQDVRDGWRGQILITSSGAARRGLPTGI